MKRHGPATLATINGHIERLHENRHLEDWTTAGLARCARARARRPFVLVTLALLGLVALEVLWGVG